MRPEQGNLQDPNITTEPSIESDEESQLQSDIVSHVNDDSVLLLSDDEEIEIAELSEEERSRTPSASSASTTAHPMLNNLILLSITTEKVDGKIKIMFSRERANTVLGEKQGDHVTSHRLFVELLNNKLKDAKISGIPAVILNTMEKIIPGFSEIESLTIPAGTDLKKTKFPLEIIKPGSNQAILDLAIQKFERGDRLERVEKLNQFLSSVIQTYNALDDVSYVKRGGQGEKGKNEGTVTHQSVCALQAINEFLEISKITDQARQEKHLLELFCKLLAVNGEYCDAATILFGKSKIDDVRAEFNIPSGGLIPEEMKKRLDPSINHGRKKIPNFNQFLKSINEKISDINVLAELSNNCFDFQYYEQSSNPDRTAHEIKRDEDKSNPEKLYNLAARHILIILEAFPELKNLDINNLIEKFAGFLHKNQKWKDCKTERGQISAEEIFEGINNRVDLGQLQIRRDSSPQIEFQTLVIS